MNLYVGTSGYSYKEWKATFYPADMSTKGMLHFYGERFKTVEINSSTTIFTIYSKWPARIVPISALHGINCTE